MEANHICKKCGGIAGWDSYFQSWICTRCGDVERKPITNYDFLIRNTPEEMAAWIADHPVVSEYDENNPQHKAWLEWLGKEASDE